MPFTDIADLAERIEYLEAAIPHFEKMQALHAEAYVNSKASGLHPELVAEYEAGIERLARYRQELRDALDERDLRDVRI
jgi:hypothetical protein